MRLPRVRLTVRRLMVGVALGALLSTLVVRAREAALDRRAQEARRRRGLGCIFPDQPGAGIPIPIKPDRDRPHPPYPELSPLEVPQAGDLR